AGVEEELRRMARASCRLRRAFEKRGARTELADFRYQVPRGGGRQRSYRREAFAERDRAILMHVLLGEAAPVIADVFGLSESQLASLLRVRAVRECVRGLRDELIHAWRSGGHTPTAIADACSVDVRTVQRVLQKPPRPAGPRAWQLVMALI